MHPSIQAMLDAGAITMADVPAMEAAIARVNPGAQSAAPTGGIAGGQPTQQGAITTAQITNWLRSNPNATSDQIRAAMQKNGVSQEQLAAAMPQLVQEDLAAIRSKYQGVQNGTQLAMAEMSEYVRANNLPPDLVASAAGQIAPNPAAWTPQRITQSVFEGIRNKQGAIGGDGAEARALGEMAGYVNATGIGADAASMAAQAIAPNPGNWTPGAVRAVLAGNPDVPRETIPTDQLPAGAYGENYGLAGAETAILTGSQLGLNQLNNTQNLVQDTLDRTGVQAGETLRGAVTDAGNTYSNTRNQVGGLFDTARTDVTGALGQTRTDLSTLFGNARTDVNNLYGQTQGQVSGLFNQGIAGLTPYIDQGQQAGNLQAALSGALGPEAQAQAYAQYQESPGVAFARAESEKSQLRNASALGGLSGGNIRDQLSRNAVGTYMQDFGNQYNRIGSVADRGLSAAGVAGGLRGQEAGIQAGLGQGQASTLTGLAGTEAGYTSNLGTTEASLLSNLGSNEAGVMAGLGTSQAGIQSGLQSNLAQIQSNLGNTGAGLQAQLGQYGSQIPVNAGNSIGGYRYQAGQDIASSIGSTASALANLVNQQGAGVADIVGNGANNINSLIQAAAAGDTAAKQQLATLLANVSSQTGSQFSSQPIVPGAPSNLLGTLGQVAGGIGGLMSAYNGQQTQPGPSGTYGANWNPTTGYWQAPSMTNRD